MRRLIRLLLPTLVIDQPVSVRSRDEHDGHDEADSIADHATLSPRYPIVS